MRRGFSLLEALVGVAIATAFLGAIAIFTTNLGDSRARLARSSREVEAAEAVFTAVESACACAVVSGGAQGAGIVGNETSVRIVRSAIGLGDDGQQIFSELGATAISFDSGSRRISVRRSGSLDMVAAPVREMRVRYLAVDGWQDAFDTSEGVGFPVGIEVSIWYDRGGDGEVGGDPPPDRTRFFRVMGAPRVDPLAIRKLDRERDGATERQR
jgi:hypothetical protein